MKNVTYLDTIRHTPDMKDMSIKTSVHPLKHQLEGSGLFKKERNMLDIMAEHKNPFRGGMLNIKQDPLRGGSVFGDILKVAGMFDPTGLVRTASFVVK